VCRWIGIDNRDRVLHGSAVASKVPDRDRDHPTLSPTENLCGDAIVGHSENDGTVDNTSHNIRRYAIRRYALRRHESLRYCQYWAIIPIYPPANCPYDRLQRATSGQMRATICIGYKKHHCVPMNSPRAIENVQSARLHKFD
jgi:hypothetical protein